MLFYAIVGGVGELNPTVFDTDTMLTAYHGVTEQAGAPHEYHPTPTALSPLTTVDEELAKKLFDNPSTSNIPEDDRLVNAASQACCAFKWTEGGTEQQRVGDIHQPDLNLTQSELCFAGFPSHTLQQSTIQYIHRVPHSGSVWIPIRELVSCGRRRQTEEGHEDKVRRQECHFILVLLKYHQLLLACDLYSYSQ